jgi:hypothetical protein
LNPLGESLPKFGFFKKPWEKVMCTYELQQYGGSEGPGWHSIAEATYTLITKAEAQEMFEPDRHYRLIARATEGPQAGRFVGVVWDHYEPFKGLVKKGTEKARTAVAKSKEPEEVLEDYADRVEKILRPLPRIFETVENIRARYIGGGGREREGEEGEAAGWSVPPPEFDGKLPVIFHPYVVHQIAEEIKGVIDFGATRMEKIFGVGGLPGGEAPKEEEEEAVLPTLESFKKKKAMEEGVTEEEEAEAEGEPTIPTPAKEEAKLEEAAEAPKEEEQEPLTEKLEREELEREFEPEEPEEEEVPSLSKKRKGRKSDV